MKDVALMTLLTTTVGASGHRWTPLRKARSGLGVIAWAVENAVNDALWALTRQRVSIINSRWGRALWYGLAGEAYVWGEWP